MMNIILAFFGFIVGGLIGAAFGTIQNAARLRNKNIRGGGTTAGLHSMFSSFFRIMLLMIALLLVQIGLPSLFDGLLRWIVSAGVTIGYGFMLFHQFRRRTNSNAAQTF
jgi:hypothetical protein